MDTGIRNLGVLNIVFYSLLGFNINNFYKILTKNVREKLYYVGKLL